MYRGSFCLAAATNNSFNTFFESTSSRAHRISRFVAILLPVANREIVIIKRVKYVFIQTGIIDEHSFMCAKNINGIHHEYEYIASEDVHVCNNTVLYNCVIYVEQFQKHTKVLNLRLNICKLFDLQPSYRNTASPRKSGMVFKVNFHNFAIFSYLFFIDWIELNNLFRSS